MKKIKPIVSVCVPVYETEFFLEKCLLSVANQKSFIDTSCEPPIEKKLPPFEIIILNDGSFLKDEKGRSCEKIVKDFKKSIFKKFGLKLANDKITCVKYIVHEKNRGLVESRRALVEEAEGSYICMLDSDDTLLENALSILYDAAITSEADIVHGGANVVFTTFQNMTEICASSTAIAQESSIAIEKKVNNIYKGFLYDKEIFTGNLVYKNHTAMLWGKLIKRDLYLESMSHIPTIFCTMADDFLIYFWISFFAKSYYGFAEKVYNYSIGVGISNSVSITSLKRWEQVCSSSSVFTAIFTEIENFPQNTFSDEQKNALDDLYHFYIYDNLRQLNQTVATEIYDVAYEMICDFWGTENVEYVSQKYM